VMVLRLNFEGSMRRRRSDLAARDRCAQASA
jgi:hypothetical protein